MARHQLPKIPGLFPSFLEFKKKYPIGTDLEVINDVRFIKSIEKRNDHRAVCDPDIAMAMLASGRDVLNKRTWMVMDKEVLAFDAYYKTVLLGSAGEINHSVRKLKIIYFLVDGTIQVNEPGQQNSGTPQGCFIKKQKIPLPGCDQELGPHYKVTDLVVGETVIFHGKELKITGVDGFTRDFLYKMGVDVKDNETIPDDPYFVYRKDTELDVTPKSKSISIRKRIPKDLDVLILKFRGYWDDRYEMDGQLHFFDVLYYLEDDTIEILEEFEDDSKSHGIAHKAFVRRQKLPMEGPWCLPPGHSNKQEILNVILNRSNSIYYKMDNRIPDERGVSYYYRTDLYIGATLNVYNRVIVLVSCDEFTKQFYKTVYGLKNFEPITAPKTMKEIEQDILNQKKVEIILKNYDEVVRKRLIKYGGTGRIFGFIIKMITNDPINQTRNFMLKYYLDDTNVAIYEYRETNSGLRGGMFRSKRESPKNQEGEDLIVFHQLVVGAEISVDDYKFIVTDIDDKTLKFMIENAGEFPHSNLATSKSKALEIINKRFSNLDEFRSKSFHDRELVEREEFRSIMSFDGELDPHVGVVLALTFKRPDPFEPYTELEFRSVVQDTLRKAQFIHFDGLKSNFKSRKFIADEDVGYLVREESMKAMKSTKVPLSLEIINMLLDKYLDTEHKRGVNFEDMINFMDYVKDPVELPTGLPRELLFVKPKKVLVKVNEFVDALRAEA